MNTRDPQYKPNLGIVGYGIVGQAVAYGFSNHNITYYDKYKPSPTLEQVVETSDIVFVCLPTPFKGRRIDLQIIEESVAEITKHTDNTDKLVVIKSTVVPGTTRKLAEQYPNTKFAFNPEFLTEANYLEDFANADRHVVGADDNKVSLALSALYKNQWPHIPVIQTDPTTAEMGKYAANCFLASKVMFANEMNDLCEALGIQWSETKKIVVADERVGPTHLDVTSIKGFGGKCLVPETKLLTEQGLVPLANVVVGQRVFDGKDFTTITAKAPRENVAVREVVTRGRKIKGSMDHIHLVYDKGQIVERELAQVKPGDWVSIPQPLIQNRTTSVVLGEKPNGYIKWWPTQIELTPKLGRLIGLYLAEGCSSGSKYGVFWSFGEHEEHLANEVKDTLANIGLNGYKRLQISQGTFGESRCWIVRCRSAGLRKVLETLGLGTNAGNKATPFFRKEVAKSVIGGWLDGDGSYYDGTVMGYSKSKTLISGIDTMLLDLGICAQIGNDGHSIKVSTRKEVEEICGWTKRFAFDSTRHVRKNSYRSPNLRKTEGGWQAKVSKIKDLPAEDVISLETESGRYTANNVLTHNCFPKDMIALLGLFEDLEVDSAMLSTVWKKNLEIRKVRDWEDIPFVKTSNEEE